MGMTSTKFLLDSGAFMSVVHYDFIADRSCNEITKDGAQNTIAADVLPLEVTGNLTIPVVLGEF